MTYKTEINKLYLQIFVELVFKRSEKIKLTSYNTYFIKCLSILNVFLFVSIGVFHFECGLFVCQFMMGLFDMYHLYGIMCSCTG